MGVHVFSLKVNIKKIVLSVKKLWKNNSWVLFVICLPTHTKLSTFKFPFAFKAYVVNILVPASEFNQSKYSAVYQAALWLVQCTGGRRNEDQMFRPLETAL